MKINKIVIITNLTLCMISILSCAQSTSDYKKNKDAALLKSTKGATDFPELIYTSIPGAPKLSTPKLIMGDTIPVRAEGNGWAAPAVYDWNSDGKKDLLIGEYNSGAKMGLNIGNLIRVYQNTGTDEAPEFGDVFTYASEANNLKESTGSPLSIFTWCCFPFIPRFADLNNDGFTDLLSGQYNPGYITWFRGSEKGFLPGIKLEEAYNPGDKVLGSDGFNLPITDPKSSNYWTYTSGSFGDFDSDGDQDMIIGGKALRFCENIGNKTTPKFGKRKLLFDGKGQQLESGVDGVPYVVDWDQDGVLDILVTDSYSKKGSVAVRFFRGLKAKGSIQFDTGVPLFKTKNNAKSFPGCWLNLYVIDWNNDGINDLLIASKVATLNGEFNHELSWNWAWDEGIHKTKNPGYHSAIFKKRIAEGYKYREVDQKEKGLSDEEYAKSGYIPKDDYVKEYYGKRGYKNKTLIQQGYVYVMLGEKR